jgi:hypothetical protein
MAQEFFYFFLLKTNQLLIPFTFGCLCCFLSFLFPRKLQPSLIDSTWFPFLFPLQTSNTRYWLLLLFYHHFYWWRMKEENCVVLFCSCSQCLNQLIGKVIVCLSLLWLIFCNSVWFSGDISWPHCHSKVLLCKMMPWSWAIFETQANVKWRSYVWIW